MKRIQHAMQVRVSVWWAGVPLLWLCLSSVSSLAQAGTHLTLSGSQSLSYTQLEEYKSRSGSASIAQDLGPYLRLGLTHSQKLDNKDGLEESKDATTGVVTYKRFSSSTKVISNSIDLTVILYSGAHFMPYIFGGAAWNAYHSQIATETETVSADTPMVGPLPTGGVGLILPIDRSFSLRASYRVSMVPNKHQYPDGHVANVMDSDTQLGVSLDL